jgi:hypothetical protein
MIPSLRSFASVLLFTSSFLILPAMAIDIDDVQTAVFTPSCALSGCHDNTQPPILLAGQSFDNIVNLPAGQMPSLNYIEPGEPSNSYLVRTIEGTGLGSRMPSGGSLSAANIQLVRDWVSQGALQSEAKNPKTGLWWNPAESGWGVTLTQQGDIIFATMFTYDTNGFPTWYVASNCAITGESCTGDLYSVVGGSAITEDWNPNLIVDTVGSITFEFDDDDNGTISFDIYGIDGAKDITRQVFN